MSDLIEHVREIRTIVTPSNDAGQVGVRMLCDVLLKMLEQREQPVEGVRCPKCDVPGSTIACMWPLGHMTGEYYCFFCRNHFRPSPTPKATEGETAAGKLIPVPTEQRDIFDLMARHEALREAATRLVATWRGKNSLLLSDAELALRRLLEHKP